MWRILQKYEDKIFKFVARFLNHCSLGAVAEDFHDSLTVQSFEDLDLVSYKLLIVVLKKL